MFIALYLSVYSIKSVASKHVGKFNNINAGRYVLEIFLNIFYADDKFIYFYHSIRWNKKMKAVCVTSSHTFRDSGIYCTKISATAGSSSSVTNRKFFPSGAISISGTNIVTIVSCYVTKAHINIGIE